MDDLLLKIYNFYFKENKILHAYLFVVDDYDLAIDFLIKLSLKINNEEITESNIEKIKNDNNFDITIINTEKNNISKENIVNIEKKYSTKSLSNNKRIYIINEAYKLNRSSSNTLLKFLEEPEENIISFLVVKNKNVLLDTIVSRCVTINVNFLKETKVENSNSFYNNIEKKYNSKEIFISNIEKTFQVYNLIDNLNIEQIKIIEILFDIYLLLKTNVNYKTVIDKLNYLLFLKKINYDLI